MTLVTVKWSIEGYHQMIEAGILRDRHVKLLNGEIVEMPPEGEPHAYYNTDVRDYLISLLGNRALIRDTKLITIPSSNSEPEPNLAIAQSLDREYLRRHPDPENILWLIEFSNSSFKKNLNPKARIYGAAGIAEYWLI